MSATNPDGTPSAIVLAWCLLGAGGLLALLGAPAAVPIFLGSLAAGVALLHRHTQTQAQSQAPDREPSRSGSGGSAGPRPVSPTPPVKPEVIVRDDLPGGDFAEIRDGGLDQLTDQQLCRAWQASYVWMKRSERAGRSFEQTLAVARARRQYLDEMERRHPRGFSAWLAAGARAPSDPIRYLSPPIPRQRDPGDERGPGPTA